MIVPKFTADSWHKILRTDTLNTSVIDNPKPGIIAGLLLFLNTNSTSHPMINSNKHHLSSRRPATHRLKKLLLLPVAGVILALSSCNGDEAKHAPPVTVTDTEPVGDGLAVIGFAIVGAAVVVVLGRLLR
jgi:hypothetical protein